jgi:hypothetical protein
MAPDACDACLEMSTPGMSNRLICFFARSVSISPVSDFDVVVVFLSRALNGIA